MSDLLIQAQDLNTFYGASHILRGVNFSVGRGETIGLMGRNGMGKSTLLKTLMGIVPPRTGSVDIKGQRMNGRPTFEVAQMGIAYVPEGRGIFGNLSVVENLSATILATGSGRIEIVGVENTRFGTKERIIASTGIFAVPDYSWQQVH